jgi:hypothetical protein
MSNTNKKSWPERRVVRTGGSPMNRQVKWAELCCGHTVYRNRRPRIGATIVCEKCADNISLGRTLEGED